MADNALEGLSIKRTSTADQVAAVLRERILRGELRPGTALREVSMAATIGVSRNTMREAIRVLVHEGLVRHSVHRGVTVTELAQKDVSDIYRVRRILELSAIKATGEDDQQLRQLEEAVNQLERAAQSKDWLGILESDMLFHRRLVGFLGSPRLDHFYQNLLAELRLALLLVDRAAPDLPQVVAQHRALYDLLTGGKQRESGQLLREHLADSERRVRAIVLAEANRNHKETSRPGSRRATGER